MGHDGRCLCGAAPADRAGQSLPAAISGREPKILRRAEVDGALLQCANAPDRTLAALVGLVFRREPTLGKDIPPAIAGPDGWAENSDQCGTHWTVWAREVFEAALKHGHSELVRGPEWVR